MTLSLSGFVVYTSGRSVLSHALLFVYAFLFSPTKHCDHLAWGRQSWSMCFSCICLFILLASISVAAVAPKPGFA